MRYAMRLFQVLRSSFPTIKLRVLSISFPRTETIFDFDGKETFPGAGIRVSEVSKSYDVNPHSYIGRIAWDLNLYWASLRLW